MKKILIAVVILFVLGVVSILVIGRTFYPDNIAETSADGGKKGLKTRFYNKDIESVRAASKNVIGKMSTWGGTWKIVDETDGGAESHIKAEIPVVMFTDDFEVKFKKNEDGKIEVNARSQSRVGKSDFGENARHIRQFLDALDNAVSR